MKGALIMIDNSAATAIVSGSITRLETMITSENDIAELKRWLMQFGRAISIVFYPQQTGGIRTTFTIAGLKSNERALIAGTLKSDPHDFRILNGDTS